MLSKLEGKKVQLYGVTDTRFKIGNGRGATLVLEARSDPDDGYRSSLDQIALASEEGCTFYTLPIAEATVCAASDIDGWVLIDERGHEWLKVGTDRSDRWYPRFVFSWLPPTFSPPVPQPMESGHAEVMEFLAGYEQKP